MKWYTYRTAARRTGRSIRTLREWVLDGMPATVDPETREVLIAEPDLFVWWRRKNRANPRMRQRVRAGLEVHAPGGGPLRWLDVWRGGTTALVDVPESWISWDAAAELATLAGGVETVSPAVLRLANRWIEGPPRPRVLRVSDTVSVVWAPDAANVGIRLPVWGFSVEGWVRCGVPTLEVREDELRAYTVENAPAWALEAPRS